MFQLLFIGWIVSVFSRFSAENITVIKIKAFWKKKHKNLGRFGVWLIIQYSTVVTQYIKTACTFLIVYDSRPKIKSLYTCNSIVILFCRGLSKKEDERIMQFTNTSENTGQTATFTSIYVYCFEYTTWVKMGVHFSSIL